MTAEFSQAMFENTVRDYVRPELERRARAGNAVPEFWAVQILFGDDATSPEVRLNEEVRLLACPAGSNEFQDYVELRAAGQRQFVEIKLPAGQEDIKHITLCQTIAVTWHMHFNFRPPARPQEPAERSASVEASSQPPTHAEWNSLYAEHDRVFGLNLEASSPSPTPEIPIEFLMISVALQRSRHLVDAYIRLIEAKNLIAASALIRMQLDSVMRVNACFLVANPFEIWEALKNDTPLNRIKSTDNERLTDAYLHQKLTEKFVWATEVYTKMSGYVHLSRPHLDSTIEGEEFLGMILRQGLTDDRITDHDVSENAKLFVIVTRALLTLCEEYAEHRVSNDATQSE